MSPAAGRRRPPARRSGPRPAVRPTPRTAARAVPAAAARQADGSAARWPRLLVVGMALAVGAGLFVACRPGSHSSEADSCAGRPDTPDAVPGAGITALLLDRSASVRGNAGPSYAAMPELDAATRAAVLRGDTITISGFDGSATTMAWATVATPRLANPDQRTSAQVASLRCARRLLADAAAAPARAAGSDILGALAAAAHQSATTSGSRHVVVSDGLVNSGCADLLESPIAGDVQKIVTDCRTAGQLPDLTGAQVTMFGIGHPADDQPSPATAQLDWLTALWRGLCGAATANPTSCDIHSEATAAAGGSVSTGPAARTPGMPDAAVTFPAVTERRDSGTIIVTLPDRMLFGTDSTELLATAQAALTDVERRVRGASGTVTEVDGHTDSRGTDDHNDLLSLGRAQRVADALRADGLTVGKAVGLGKSRPSPACGPEHRTNDSADPAAMSCNRRVEIVIALGQTRG